MIPLRTLAILVCFYPLLATSQTTITSSNNVAIGGSEAPEKLTVNDGALLINSYNLYMRDDGVPSGNDPGDIIFKDATGIETGRIWSYYKASLSMRGKPIGYPDIFINNAYGNVSIQPPTYDHDNTYKLKVYGNFWHEGTRTSSSLSVKNNIKDVEVPLYSNLLLLKSIVYNYDAKAFLLPSINDTSSIGNVLSTPSFEAFKKEIEGDKRYGLSAQEIEKYYPNLVRTEGNGLKAINYTELIPILVGVMKQQQATIAELKKQIK